MSLHSKFPHHNTAMGRHLAKRWCVLAESRLAYLTELFETGRWRRFHSEVEFLDNIQEARNAVDRWRAMAAGEFGQAPALQGETKRNGDATSAARPWPTQISLAPDLAPADDQAAPVLIPIERLLRRAPPRDFAKRTAPLPEMSAAPAEPNWKTALDQASIEERYPMLRAAM